MIGVGKIKNFVERTSFGRSMNDIERVYRSIPRKKSTRDPIQLFIDKILSLSKHKLIENTHFY